MFYILDTYVLGRYLLLAGILAGFIGVNPEIFTSTSQLRILYEKEDLIYPYVQDYIDREKERLQQLQRILDQRKDILKQLDVKEETEPQPATDTSLDCVGHPINVYHLIQRLYRIGDLIWGGANENDLTEKLEKSAAVFPQSIDYSGAMAAMLRLQRVYNLSTNDLLDGVVKGRSSLKALTPSDAYKLGLAAKAVEDYGLSVEWLSRALDRGDGIVPWKHAMMALAESYYMMGNYPRAIDLISEVYAKYPEDSTVVKRSHLYRQQAEKAALSDPSSSTQTWTPNIPDHMLAYEALCRGDNIEVNPIVQAQLHCIKKKTNIPYAPVKEEVLNLDPRISLFYDVISDKEAELLKELGFPKMKRALIQGGDYSEKRVGKVGWLYDTEYTAVDKLTQRVESITGLSGQYSRKLISGEPFQIVNYGIGGHYEPHPDYLVESKYDGWNRMSTFMFYLNQPVEGGYTVFIDLNVRVPPVKNAAAFWHNLRPSGERDDRTWHAGCPVLLGEKWVANKWIHECGQEFRRPCGKSYDAMDVQW